MVAGRYRSMSALTRMIRQPRASSSAWRSMSRVRTVGLVQCWEPSYSTPTSQSSQPMSIRPMKSPNWLNTSICVRCGRKPAGRLGPGACGSPEEIRPPHQPTQSPLAVARCRARRGVDRQGPRLRRVLRGSPHQCIQANYREGSTIPAAQIESGPGRSRHGNTTHYRGFIGRQGVVVEDDAVGLVLAGLAELGRKTRVDLQRTMQRGGGEPGNGCPPLRP